MPSRTPYMSGGMGPMPSMVGRTAERVLLREQFAAAEAGHGQFVMIGGEAGIGKTTLIRDLIATARDAGYTVLIGHNYDLTAAAPYSLWLDLAARYQQSGEIARMPHIPAALVSPSLEGFTSQAELFAGMISFLHDVSVNQPALVVLEDVHWADPASLELLRHTASRVGRLRILLVVTYRVDELTRQNPFYRQLPALIRESEGLRLDLKRLSVNDIQQVVDLRYAMPNVDRDRLVDYLERYAEGNPFFALELLRSLEEHPADGLTRTATGWALARLDRIVMPSLVRQVIEARVSKLGEDTRHPLAVAAVIGHEVQLDLWASITNLDRDALYTMIDRATDWHLFSATPDGTRIHFVHALTREALYEGILPPRRRLLHQVVAESLLRQPQPDPDAIAYHFQHAGDPRAPEWLIQAGERAQRAYAWLTASDRFAAAAKLLEAVPGKEGTRARLLYRCGRLQRYSDAPSGIADLEVATRLAEGSGDKVLAADAIYSRGLLRCFADDWRLGLHDMIRGVERLEALPPEEARISWATVNWMADALPAIDLATSGDLDPASDKLTRLGVNYRRGSLPWFLAAVGRLDEARDIARTYRDHVADVGTGPLVLSNLGHTQHGLGAAFAAVGQPDDAHAAFNAARDIYLRIDHHAVIAFVHLTELTDVAIPYHTTNIAERQRLADAAQVALERASGAFSTGMSERLAQLTVMYLDGRWSDARQIAEESATYGPYVVRRQVTRALAPIARHQGRSMEAWGHILEILPDGPISSLGSAVLLDALMLQQLAVHLALDEGDEGGLEYAYTWLDANDDWLRWSGSVLGHAGNELAWARFHRSRGDHGKAWDHAIGAIMAASDPEQPLVLMEASRLLGELALAAGDLPTARRELTTSLELADACAIPFQRALSLVELAQANADVTPDLAYDMVTEAREICERLGAEPTLTRIDALFKDFHQGGRNDPVPGGLTPRETEVLRLVAKGLTDAEVGNQLFISPRTVGQHLRSIYDKLDVRSRTEATLFAMEHGFG